MVFQPGGGPAQGPGRRVRRRGAAARLGRHRRRRLRHAAAPRRTPAAQVHRGQHTHKRTPTRTHTYLLTPSILRNAWNTGRWPKKARIDTGMRNFFG